MDDSHHAPSFLLITSPLFSYHSCHASQQVHPLQTIPANRIHPGNDHPVDNGSFSLHSYSCPSSATRLQCCFAYSSFFHFRGEMNDDSLLSFLPSRHLHKYHPV